MFFARVQKHAAIAPNNQLDPIRGFDGDSIVIEMKLELPTNRESSKHIKSVKHKHVFPDLCSKRGQEGREREKKTGQSRRC